MRFIGNKELIISDIFDLLNQQGLVNKNLTFFDAFTGTGAVSDALKNSFNIISNDMIKWSTIYTQGRVCANDATFDTLGFDPIDFFNSSDKIIEGFFFKKLFSREFKKNVFF